MAESKANFNRQDEEEKRGDKQLPEESGGTATCYHVSNNPSIIVNSQGIYGSSELQLCSLSLCEVAHPTQPSLILLLLWALVRSEIVKNLSQNSAV